MVHCVIWVMSCRHYNLKHNLPFLLIFISEYSINFRQIKLFHNKTLFHQNRSPIIALRYCGKYNIISTAIKALYTWPPKLFTSEIITLSALVIS